MSVGLVLFLVMLAVDVAAMLLDLELLLAGKPTITQHVLKHPVFAIPILGWQAMGVLGLADHLVGSPVLGFF
jgi:hypothetical protein